MTEGRNDDSGNALIGIGRANGRSDCQQEMASAIRGLIREAEALRRKEHVDNQPINALASSIRLATLREVLKLVTGGQNR